MIPPQAEASLALEYSTDTRKLREERGRGQRQAAVLPMGQQWA